MQEDPRIEAVQAYISRLVADGPANAQEQGVTVCDNSQELVVDDEVAGFSVRILQYKDINYKNKDSYKEANRAKAVDTKSKQKMLAKEPPMDRAVETYMIAKRISEREGPIKGKSRDGTAKLAEGYKAMRSDTYASFWLENTRDQRDELRSKAREVDGEYLELINQINKEDNSKSEDHFYKYQIDEVAAMGTEIYDKADQDLIFGLDGSGKVILIKISSAFQLLFGEARMKKVEDATRQWTSLPPLKVPNNSRHRVDAMIRQRHPEMNIEKATTLEEVEARYQLVGYYGTWAMKGHANPDRLYKTPDTLLKLMRRKDANTHLLMNEFIEKAAGLSSEVVRFAFQLVDGELYSECCENWKAIPKDQQLPMREPNFSHFFALGVNAWTQRHQDARDVEQGLVGLVALGNYTGMAAKLHELTNSPPFILKMPLSRWRFLLPSARA